MMAVSTRGYLLACALICCSVQISLSIPMSASQMPNNVNSILILDILFMFSSVGSCHGRQDGSSKHSLAKFREGFGYFEESTADPRRTLRTPIVIFQHGYCEASNCR